MPVSDDSYETPVENMPPMQYRDPDSATPNWKRTAPLNENVVANYHVTTRIDDRTIAFQRPVDDPFITHTVTLGWSDLLRGLLRRRLDVTVLVGADTGRMDAVLNLDDRTRRY